MHEAERGREAAVILGCRRNQSGRLVLLFVQRSQVGRHGAQISLPGGLIEHSDRGPAAAAIRETSEEIGVAADRIHILESLPGPFRV